MARNHPCSDSHLLYGEPQGRGFLCNPRLSGAVFSPVTYRIAFRVLPAGTCYYCLRGRFHLDNSQSLPQEAGCSELPVEAGDNPVMGVRVGISRLVSELLPFPGHGKG